MYPSSQVVNLATGPVSIQADYRIYYETCHEAGCETLVLWYDHGEDGDPKGAFAPVNCTCDGGFDSPKATCCVTHAKTFVCKACTGGSGAEEETRPKKRLRDDEKK